MAFTGGDTIIVDGIETEDFSTLLTGSEIEYLSGAGFDVDGKFQLGSNCSEKCK